MFRKKEERDALKELVAKGERLVKQMEHEHWDWGVCHTAHDAFQREAVLTVADVKPDRLPDLLPPPPPDDLDLSDWRSFVFHVDQLVAGLKRVV